MLRGTACEWGALLAVLASVAACRGKPTRRASSAVQSSSSPVPAASATTHASSPRASSSALGIDAPVRALRSAPYELTDCANAELRACLAPFIKPELTPKEMQGLADAFCFKAAGEALAQAGDCLPLRAGVDARNGKALLFSFVCSDVCPDQGSVMLRYEHVDEAECCQLGGEPRHIWPDSYVGCYPADYAATMGVYLVTPDGKWQHVRSSLCPKRKPLILAEWPCEPLVATRRALGVTGGPVPAGLRYAANAQFFSESSCEPRFDAAVAERALSEFDAPARECVTSHRPGQATIRIRFARTGKVADVSLSEPSWLNDAQGRCIERAFQQAMIAPFRDKRGELFHGLLVP